MAEHEILKTETFEDWNGNEHLIAKVKSAFSNKTMWARCDDDGVIDLPFFKSHFALTQNILRQTLLM